MSRIQKTIERETSIFAWSDSKIVLAWIQNNSNKEKFIKTRTTDILRGLPNASWQHVKTKNNPADVASRGIDPDKLKSFSWWWNGPTWLSIPENCWPINSEIDVESNSEVTIATNQV